MKTRFVVLGMMLVLMACPRQAQEMLANEPTKIVIAPIQIAAIEIRPLVKLQNEAEIQKSGRRE